jgi:hypothetical protein
LDECHVCCNSSTSPPRHTNTTLCRRFVDRLLLLRRSFKGATNNRGHAPRRGHSPRTTQGLFRYSDPDPDRPFGLHHLLHWERSPAGPREEKLRAVSSSACATSRGSQESSSRRLRPPSAFRGGNHVLFASIVGSLCVIQVSCTHDRDQGPRTLVGSTNTRFVLRLSTFTVRQIWQMLYRDRRVSTCGHSFSPHNKSSGTWSSRRWARRSAQTPLLVFISTAQE